MGGGERVEHAGSVDVAIKDSGFMTGEQTAVDDPCKFLTFGFEHSGLVNLATCGGFMTT